MNFGFALTGAHVAPAESPWKMEFNYRYINNKSPLFFVVVYVGNMREFLLELSANVKMLWDYYSYDTDEFLLDYCIQYFGAKHSETGAQLYKAFYNAYWQPKETEFVGMECQFLLQDLRYTRAFQIDSLLNNNKILKQNRTVSIEAAQKLKAELFQNNQSN
jgi:hypothetical protein